MTILVISGPPKSGKTMVAVALRNNQITNGKSALLIDEQQDGELLHLIEKIIAGDPLKPGTAADQINWKPEPLVILVGARETMLAEIEQMVPGFGAKHAPILRLTTARG